MSGELQLRIGIEETRELVVDLDRSETPESLDERVTAVFEQPGGLLWFLDDRGRRFGIDPRRITYIEVDDRPSA